MKQAPRIAAVLVIVALLFPPWRIAWAPASGGPSPVPIETTWAGFHFWVYATERPTKVVAWDGPGTGGHVELEGTPEIAFGPWAGILLLGVGVVYLAMRAGSRSLLGLAICLAALGCGAGWHTVRSPEPATYRARQQAQIWHAGKATQVHGLRLTSDSVSAVPYLQPATCDSCRITWVRAEVDSIRLGDPSGGFLASLLGALGAFTLVMLLLCGYGSCGGAT